MTAAKWSEYGCIVCTFGILEKFLPALQQGHVARPFLYSRGGLEDQGDLGDREDQQVQPGLDHPDGKNKNNNQISERNTRNILVMKKAKH